MNSPNGALPVLGVKELLLNGLSEIIRNAVQYSPEGGEVQIVLRQRDGRATVEVIDRGIGISVKDQADIWNVMTQSDRDRNEQQGVGMGLPIARGLIEAHGGEIGLSSVEGEGTHVVVTLPLADAES